MMLQNFIETQNNRVVSFDGNPSNAGQSPQLIATWCTYLGLPYQWANAYDWWDGSDETFTDHWRKVNRTDQEHPSPGDIMVFSNLLPGSDGYGHLSLFVEGDPGVAEWTGFDANWGGQSAHLQSHSYAYVIGWFTPINKAVLEARIPTSIAEPTPSDPYDVEPITPIIVTLKNDEVPVYNLNNVAWNSFNQDPITHLPIGTVVEIVAVAKHRLGGTFLLPDIDHAQGYSVDDCEGYGDAPVPQVEIDPEKIISGPGSKIFAPFKAPSSTDTVSVNRPIPTYRSMSDALQGQHSTGQLKPKRYYVYKRLPNGMMNITSQLGQSSWWIDPADLEEKPAKQEADWHVLVPFDKPRYYTAKATAAIVDVDGLKPDLGIKGGQPILIAGFFRGPDNEIYGAPDVTYNGLEVQWYGLKRDNMNPYKAPQPEPDLVPTVTVAPSLTFRDIIKPVIDNNQLFKRLKEKYRSL